MNKIDRKEYNEDKKAMNSILQTGYSEESGKPLKFKSHDKQALNWLMNRFNKYWKKHLK